MSGCTRCAAAIPCRSILYPVIKSIAIYTIYDDRNIGDETYTGYVVCASFFIYVYVNIFTYTCTEWNTVLCVHRFACVCMYVHTGVYMSESGHTRPV